MKLKILQQGSAIVNLDSIHINFQNEKVVLAEIDMTTKWCEISSTFSGNDGSLGFTIATTERSHPVKKDASMVDTEVLIEDYDSETWDIFCIDCSRYTIRIVLINR